MLIKLPECECIQQVAAKLYLAPGSIATLIVNLERTAKDAVYSEPADRAKKKKASCQRVITECSKLDIAEIA